MKKELQSILFCLGLSLVIFSGCEKQGQSVPPSATSAKATNTAEENRKNKDEQNDKRNGHTFDNTFTKWIFDFPHMMGVVGGDVGTGTFAGDVLSLSTVGDITSIEAIYHFNGRFHRFTAQVFVTQNNVAGTATITGSVTEGWLEGATITGEYNVFGVCPISTPGNIEGTRCYSGTLHIHVPKDRRED
jgi:hypothetical protein